MEKEEEKNKEKENMTYGVIMEEEEEENLVEEGKMPAMGAVEKLAQRP